MPVRYAGMSVLLVYMRMEEDGNKGRLIGYYWIEMHGIEDCPVGLGLDNLPSLQDRALPEDGDDLDRGPPRENRVTEKRAASPDSLDNVPPLVNLLHTGVDEIILLPHSRVSRATVRPFSSPPSVKLIRFAYYSEAICSTTSSKGGLM